MRFENCLPITYLFFGFGLGQDAASDYFRIQAYGTEIDGILVNKIFRDYTGIETLEEKYKSHNLAVIERNRSQMVKQKVNVLKKIFKSRESLVKGIAEKAEKLRAEEPGPLSQDNITFFEASVDGYREPGYYKYRNAKCNCNHQRPDGVSESNCTQSASGYKVSSHFGRIPVSYESTSVHIPTEEFNGDPNVLKDIYLGRGIDDIMKAKVCSSGDFSNLTRWVYFTTARSGAMRFLPDRVWTEDCESPDVYDSRTAPWFLNSVSSSKDVVVLIDNSGSVKGLTLNLLHRSVKDLLDTLTTNDYVNIVLFNEEANFIDNRCRQLLQATPRNKQLLRDWMYRIQTKNQAFYEKGFDLAFRTLNETQRAEVDAAKCNPTMVFFTDGDSVYPTAEMEKWNNAGDKRVFTFAVGKNFYGKDATREIACRNRGYYNDVPSFTATKSSVHKCLLKISEPLADSMKETVKWTLPYKDKLGLGIVLSVSTPVFESKEDRKIVAGVVGADLLLEDLKKILTEPGMGYDYYPFLVDSNGFAVIHPNLIETNHDDMIAVDFLEVEHSNLISVRNDIVDGNSGSTLLAKDVIIDRKYIATTMYSYDYAPVGDTTFKFGVGVHASKLKFLDTVSALDGLYPGLTLQKFIDGQASDTTALLYSSPCIDRNTGSFNPCEATEDSQESRKYSAKLADGLSLSEVVTDDSCELQSQLFSGLLLHGSMSDELAATKWEGDSLLRDAHGILAMYTALDAPSFVRTKYLNFTKQTNAAIEKDDEQVKEEIKKILANPHDNSYMRRAIHKPDWTIFAFVEPSAIVVPTSAPDFGSTLFTTMRALYETKMITTIDPTKDFTTMQTSHWQKNVKPGYILASKVVRVTENERSLAPVVTGVVLHPDTFQRNVFGLWYKCGGDANCEADDRVLMCNDTEDTECIILDDGGFLLASNQPKHYDMLNKFFGLIDGELTRRLINTRVYDIHKVNDYQGVCAKEKNSQSAGKPRCFVPTIADLLSLGWWLSSCARIFLSSLVQTLVLNMWSFADLGSSLFALPGAELATPQEYCILQKRILTYGSNSHGPLSGKFDCTESCARSYTTMRIENTNLLLIVSPFNPTCMECTTVSPFENKEIKVTVDVTCSNETDRHRKPPDDQCYDARTYPEENDSPCSSAQALHPHRIMPLVFLLIWFQFVV